LNRRGFLSKFLVGVGLIPPLAAWPKGEEEEAVTVKLGHVSPSDPIDEKMFNDIIDAVNKNTERVGH
jgi:hypothetical protein